MLELKVLNETVPIVKEGGVKPVMAIKEANRAEDGAFIFQIEWAEGLG